LIDAFVLLSVFVTPLESKENFNFTSLNAIV
jgi:hypothetical protein